MYLVTDSSIVGLKWIMAFCQERHNPRHEFINWTSRNKFSKRNNFYLNFPLQLNIYMLNQLFTSRIFVGYIRICIFLHTWMAQVVEILPQGRQAPTYLIQSTSWLLMTWQCKEPWHQQPWYWPSSFPRMIWAIHVRGSRLLQMSLTKIRSIWRFDKKIYKLHPYHLRPIID